MIIASIAAMRRDRSLSANGGVIVRSVSSTRTRSVLSDKASSALPSLSYKSNL